MIEESRQKEKEKFIKAFDQDPELQILNGRWGAYIKHKGNNYKIPKGSDPVKLTFEECVEIIAKQPATNGKKGKPSFKRKAKK